MIKLIRKAHKATAIRRKAGEFKGKKCIVCDAPERMEHHDDYKLPITTKPVCSMRCHRIASFR